MSNGDKMCACHHHYLAGSKNCYFDKCGLNGKGCILAETKVIYATPETQEWFGAYRSKAVPVHHDCPNWEKETLPAYEATCKKYASDGMVAKWEVA